MRTPREVYQNSRRKYDGGIEELDYGQMETRRVNKQGCISWSKQPLFVSCSLAGWSVGLKPNEQQQLEVWFAKILLGWIDPRVANFFRADIGPKKTDATKKIKKNGLENSKQTKNM